VSPALVGIVTHSGERTHAHWVSPDGNRPRTWNCGGLRPERH
jgi:hypothetical protein